MTVKLTINGAPIALLRDPFDCVWSDDTPAERTHSGAPQSQEFVGVTFDWPPLPVAEWEALNAAVDALGGQITSLTAIGRDYEDADTWQAFTATHPQGMWPERPKGRLDYHHIVGSGRLGGPTWHVAFVAPARV